MNSKSFNELVRFKNDNRIHVKAFFDECPFWYHISPFCCWMFTKPIHMYLPIFLRHSHETLNQGVSGFSKISNNLWRFPKMSKDFVRYPQMFWRILRWRENIIVEFASQACGPQILSWWHFVSSHATKLKHNLILSPVIVKNRQTVVCCFHIFEKWSFWVWTSSRF